jgi:hypothetical protein
VGSFDTRACQIVEIAVVSSGISLNNPDALLRKILSGTATKRYYIGKAATTVTLDVYIEPPK